MKCHPESTASGRSTPSLGLSAATWLVLASTLAGYVLLIDSRGTSDVPYFWLRWIDLIREHGVIGGYVLAHSDYLPGTFVGLAAIYSLGNSIGLSTFIVLKIAIIAAAWAGALVYWAWSRDLRYTTGFLLALLISSAAHGYLDAFYLPPLLLMLRSLVAGQLFAAGLFLGLALSFKWQPLLLVPFVLVYVLDRRSWRPVGRLAAGAALPLVLQVSMVGVHPLAGSFARAISHHALSYQGLNINWVSQMVLYKARGYTGAAYEIRPPRVLALAMKSCFFLAFSATLAALWSRTQRQTGHRHVYGAFADLIWCAFTGSFAYFALNIGVHENHLFVTMVLAFALLAIRAPRAWLACMFCALSFNINLILFYGLRGDTPVDAALANPASIVFSLINTACLGVCLCATVRRSLPSCSVDAIVRTH